MEYRYYLGVDPDTEKSGVALWDRLEQRFIFITNLDFWSLVEFIKSGHLLKHGDIEGWSHINFKVVVDAGWLVEKTNFHHNVKNPKVREKMSMNIGRNHQVGILIVDYCKRHGFNHELHEPSGKLDARTFRNITKWNAQTNQDNRDAAMIVFKR